MSVLGSFKLAASIICQSIGQLKILANQGIENFQQSSHSYLQHGTTTLQHQLTAASQKITEWGLHSLEEAPQVLFVGLILVTIYDTLRRSLGIEVTPLHDPSTEHFTTEQSDLLTHVMRRTHNPKILRYEAGTETIEFLSSPTGFGVIALVADPVKRDHTMILLAETPDSILKLLGYPEESYNPDYTHRRVYILGSKPQAQSHHTYLHHTLAHALRGKTVSDIGMANLIPAPTNQENEFILRSNACLFKLAPHTNNDGSQGWSIHYRTQHNGNHGLVADNHHLHKIKKLPPDLSFEEARVTAHITFLRLHHKTKETMAGLRHRTTQEVVSDFAVETARNIRHNLPHTKTSLDQYSFVATVAFCMELGNLAHLAYHEILKGPLSYLLGLKPPLPKDINHLRKAVDVYHDLGMPIFALKDLAEFKRLKPLQLSDGFEHTYYYDKVLQYFQNFSAKPVGCIIENQSSFYRPGGISVTYPANKPEAVIFGYDPSRSVWNHAGWDDDTAAKLPRLASQDTPSYAKECFGPDHTNSLILVNSKLYVVTPEQLTRYLAGKSQIPRPGQYSDVIKHQKAVSHTFTRQMRWEAAIKAAVI